MAKGEAAMDKYDKLILIWRIADNALENMPNSLQRKKFLDGVLIAITEVLEYNEEDDDDLG